jgi:hypothetical protein
MKNSSELKGHGVKSLGPSDSSDSGSDLPDPDREDTSDRHRTGERLTAGRERVRPDADRDTDRVVNESEAGLGGGLDQAEEARLGVTDEELKRRR